jgi:hypothetical protein
MPSIRSFRVARTALAALLVVPIAISCASCAAGGGHPMPQRSTGSSPDDLARLPSPNSPGSGPGYHLLVASKGTGPRAIGRFAIAKGKQLTIQIACSGNSPLTIVQIVTIGPCSNGRNVEAAQTTISGDVLDLQIDGSSQVAWSIYVVQQS